MQELIENVIKWANDKNLLKEENAPKQYLKIIEEIGETCGAILKGNVEGQKDGIGDTIVTLIIYSEQIKLMYNTESFTPKKHSEIKQEPSKYILYILKELHFNATDIMMYNIFSGVGLLCESLGFTPQECLQAAWDEIKDRTGQTINGTFIKYDQKKI